MKDIKTGFASAVIVPLFFFTTVVDAATCEGVVKEIDKWYSDTSSTCGIDPAADCSGVMLRATHRWDERSGNPEKIPAPTDPLKYHVWNPSPASVESGGVSVSWIRSDRIAYKDPGMRANNGIIFTPRQFVNDREKKLNVVCAFPIDAWTDTRSGRGCLDNSTTVEAEDSCQALGVNSATNWTQHYNSLNANSLYERHRKQCGFSLHKDLTRAQRTQAFQQFIAARQAIADTAEAKETQTELRIATWENDKVPVAAFFYSAQTGKKQAMKNQFDYYQHTGQWVPAIKMEFPQDANSKANFSCEADAQHRDLPRPINKTSPAGYIQSATWIQRDGDPHLGNGVWTLSVTPTAHARTIGADETEAMYAELLRKYGDDPRWSGDKYGGGMRRQLVCHLTGADNGRQIRNKPTFNMEPVRPDASHQQSIAEGCNVWPAVPYL
ncbi:MULTISPECIES: DUF2599 domain-containing protein [Pseudomonas]|uniref:DUF2599 domain-containing protein n=1 Tax=Pseudomonas putida S13.1.2 TaxID=1384061 RepID=A0AAU8SMC5_PSEPU|nr:MULTISPECIES: DUF2599 domain-containing protein [Pseudomonas]AJQ51048.1 hypothetical protein N805_29030 [Pseudomonas putida S13.1.2]